MSAYTDRLARARSAGYAEAMTDLLDAYDRGGITELLVWMTNNSTDPRAAAVARDMGMSDAERHMIDAERRMRWTGKS